MIVRTETVTRPTTAETDLLDVTDDVRELVRQAAVSEGQVTVFVPGSTASVTTIEYESGALSDLRGAIERMAPAELEYEHNKRWGDGNGYSHVRSALLGPSVTVPICSGELQLGTWQQILLCDFDNRPRERRLLVTVLGE